MGSVTQELARFAVETGFGDLPTEVVHEAKRVLLDSVGCALAGLSTDKGKLATRLARRLGGPSEATILGVGDKVSCCSAAFANGELINSLDMDAVLLPPGHVSPFVIPVPLALAESSGASGKDLIVAIALGHEISTRMGGALRGPKKYVKEPGDGRVEFSSVHGYGSCVFGGVAAAGKILGFDLEKMCNAMGIAGYNCPVPTFMKWANTPHSAMTKYLSGGWMAQTAIVAALLAEMGYLGDSIVLDGSYGFWRFFASDRWRPDSVVEKLGEEWRFLNMAYKPYPCCRIMHTALDLFIKIIEENNLLPEEIDSVRVLLDPLSSLPLWRNRELGSHVDAQFSVAYVFAVACHRIRAGVDWQDPAVIQNPRVLRFMDKVSFDPHPDFDKKMLEDARNTLARVEVIARGMTFSEEKTWAKGESYFKEARMSDQDLIDKFEHNARIVLSSDRLDKAWNSILRLEKLEDISELMELLSPSGARTSV